MATSGRWKTALAYGDTDRVVIRGYDLTELVGNISFPAAILLLATSELPSEGQAKTLEAMLVSVIDHGIVPSSIVTRYLASSGTPLQAAVAGGVMSFGDIYGGASEQLAEQIAAHRPAVEAQLTSAAEAGAAIVAHFTGLGSRVPGYGHALHPHGDPRVPRLYAIADVNGVTGIASVIATAVEDALAARKGRRVHMNQDGALAALGLDLGLDWRLARALAFIPRTAGLSVHAVEEMTREAGWRHVPDSEVDYDGPPPRPLETKR